MAKPARSPEVRGLRRVSERIIYPHVYESSDREVGGILVGRATSPGALPRITGAIPAADAEERRATLTFTQDTWEHVHRVMDRDHPDDAIVGWYHSHPSFGIFLSEHDLFIHRNFFGGPSQVALVVDPIYDREGIFVWRDGDVVDLYERPVPGTEGRQVPSKGAKRGGEDVRARSGRYPRMLLLLGVLCGVLLGLGGWTLAVGTSNPAGRPAASTLPAATSRTAGGVPAPSGECEERHELSGSGDSGFQIPCEASTASTSTDATQTRTSP